MTSRPRIRDVTDGTGNTILFGEYAYSRRLNPTDPRIINGGGHVMVDAAYNLRERISSFVSAIDGVNPISLSTAPRRQSLNSVHPGGAQIVLADGSVRFLSENINYDPLRVDGTSSSFENDPDRFANSVLEFLFVRDDGNVLGES